MPVTYFCFQKIDWSIFKPLLRIQSSRIISFMIQFWCKYPTNVTGLHNRKFYHEMIIQFLLSTTASMDSELVNNMLRQQRMAQNGLTSKTFALHRFIGNDSKDVVSIRDACLISKIIYFFSDQADPKIFRFSQFPFIH